MDGLGIYRAMLRALKRSWVV